MMNNLIDQIRHISYNLPHKVWMGILQEFKLKNYSEDELKTLTDRDLKMLEGRLRRYRKCT